MKTVAVHDTCVAVHDKCAKGKSEFKNMLGRQRNLDILNNVRYEVSRHFRNKRRHI